MKRILFLIFAVTIPSITFNMQKSSDKKIAKRLLRESYAQRVLSNFKPTTRTFMEQNPTADESKILQRYVQEVVDNAMRDRKEDLPLNTIGNEYQNALKSTPAFPARLNWIITGKEPDPDQMSLAEVCDNEWKDHLKEIETKIEQSNR